jgi:hypothetical protein
MAKQKLNFLLKEKRLFKSKKEEGERKTTCKNKDHSIITRKKFLRRQKIRDKKTACIIF